MQRNCINKVLRINMPSSKSSKSGNLWFTVKHLCVYSNMVVDFYSFPKNKVIEVQSFKIAFLF